ncbi:MAG: hypothetical protein ACKON9_21570, partial [Planctomycetaceae bacterium]
GDRENAPQQAVTGQDATRAARRARARARARKTTPAADPARPQIPVRGTLPSPCPGSWRLGVALQTRQFGSDAVAIGSAERPALSAFASHGRH